MHEHISYPGVLKKFFFLSVVLSLSSLSALAGDMYERKRDVPYRIDVQDIVFHEIPGKKLPQGGGDVHLYPWFAEGGGTQLGLIQTMSWISAELVETRILINGQNVQSLWWQTSDNGGILPEGTTPNLNKYNQISDTLLPFFLPVGTYPVEVQIFPYPYVSIYWSYLFSARITSFHLWHHTVCQPRPSWSKFISINYRLEGNPPTFVEVQLKNNGKIIFSRTVIAIRDTSRVVGGPKSNVLIEVTPDEYKKIAERLTEVTITVRDNPKDTVTKTIWHRSPADVPVCSEYRG